MYTHRSGERVSDRTGGHARVQQPGGFVARRVPRLGTYTLIDHNALFDMLNLINTRPLLDSRSEFTKKEVFMYSVIINISQY